MVVGFLQVKGMLTDFGDDMHCQFLEIIRSLLDSFSSGGQVRLLVAICQKWLFRKFALVECFYLKWKNNCALFEVVKDLLLSLKPLRSKLALSR